MGRKLKLGIGTISLDITLKKENVPLKQQTQDISVKLTGGCWGGGAGGGAA